jgi:hypothetical protein
VSEVSHRRPDAYGTEEPLDTSAVPQREVPASYEARLPLDERAARTEAVWLTCVLMTVTVPGLLLLRHFVTRPLEGVARALLWSAVLYLAYALLAVLFSKKDPGRWARHALVALLVLLPFGLLKVGREPRTQGTLLLTAALMSYGAKRAVARSFVWWMTAGELVESKTRDRLRAEWSSPGDRDLLLAFLAAAVASRLARVPALFVFLLAVSLLRGVRMKAPVLGGAWVAWRALVVFLGYNPAGWVHPLTFEFPASFPFLRRRSARRILVSAPVLGWGVLLVSTVPFPTFRGLPSVLPMALYCSLPALTFFVVLWLTEA